MPKTQVLTIEAHVLEHRTGGWCGTCLLPSVVEADIAFVWPSSLRVFHRYTSKACVDCGQ